MAHDAIELLREVSSRLGGAEATAEVDGLIKRLDRYSHLPGSIKGIAKLDFSQAVCDAALQVVRDVQGRGPDGLQRMVDDSLFDGWAIIALAARAEPALLGDVVATVAGEYVPKRAAEVRRATEQALTRRDKAPSDAPKTTPAADDVPQSVGKVKAWLAAGDRDPSVLAPRPKQKAAAQAAAIRALGQLGTAEAFEVLKGYATDSPSTQMVDELHRAWGRFDRREYAAAMLVPVRGHLDLSIATDLTGIDAVPGLTSLRIVVDDKKDDQTDLTPLSACAGLTELRLQFNGPGRPSNIAWLDSLPGLRSLDLAGPLGSTDLSPLRRSAIERLTLWLDQADGSLLLDMPKLANLTVIGSEANPERPSQRGPAHPELNDVIFALVRRGVQVTVYDFDEPWVTELLPEAERVGLQLRPKHGKTTIQSA